MWFLYSFYTVTVSGVGVNSDVPERSRNIISIRTLFRLIYTSACY